MELHGRNLCCSREPAGWVFPLDKACRPSSLSAHRSEDSCEGFDGNPECYAEAAFEKNKERE
jgi:hypothetical protein